MERQLILWAEDSSAPAESAARGVHPFAVPPPLDLGAPGETVLLLPGTARSPLPSPELGLEPPAGRVTIRPWRVPTLSLDPAAALLFLLDPPSSAAASVRYLAVVARDVLDLVRRGRVLPGVIAERGGYAARWRPVITGADRSRFLRLAEAMPPVVRAAGHERPSAEVLASILTALCDQLVRLSLPASLAPSGWVRGLTGDPAVELSPAEASRLMGPLDAWLDAATKTEGPVRVSFRLREPEDDDAWQVELALQSAEDPSLYVQAAGVWEGQRMPGFKGSSEEVLLAGLGRAVRLYPHLESALRTARPGALMLDTADAFGFLRDAAPLLKAAGFGVQLPAWAGRTGLGLRLTTRTRSSSPGAVGGSGFGMDQLVEFRYDLAVGGETITEQELAELARLKVPLVRVRGQWVELDDRQLKAALRAVESRRSGEMSAAEVIREVIAGGEDELPLIAVDADGWLGDLLSGQAHERLVSIPTPSGFAGSLRPYQERGLAWLHFLSQLGLGAVLADDMGLGKCVLPHTPVFVNGTLISAKDIWGRYAGPVISDGEGEWASPVAPLETNALHDRGQIVRAPITRLYRQHVSEKVRRVRLDDGSDIIMTRRHRLLGLDGWTHAIAPGDLVCVPRRIEWSGQPVDRDLVRLMAWQISEGYEEPNGRVRITQKDLAVLDRVLNAANVFARRSGITLNSPRIASGTRCPALDIHSAAYRDFLEHRGYRWGRQSAHKRIPDFIMASDDESVLLFLREYFTAEGSVVLSTRVVEISSASPWLMRQLVVMLRRFGIWLRVSVKLKHASNGTGIKRPYRVGIIGGPGLRLFRELVGFSDPVKQAKLDVVCAKPPNTNVEGAPGSDLLRRAQRVSGLPMRHFGLGTVYFTGTQELSRPVARAAVAAIDRILSGEAERTYLSRPKSKWTKQIAGSYAALDRDEMAAVKGALADRTEREVFYARVISVEDVEYEGYVYDLEVAEHHNFVAAGMLCHNTAQTLSLLLAERAEQAVEPTLLVCPMSLVGNWQREAARFAPSLRVHVHHGGSRLRGSELVEAAGAADLVITTYGTALRDREELAGVGWGRVVCDEAQAIKNSGARQAQAVRSLKAGTRLALTGTPVENHLAELWSIMEFANPGLLGPAAQFRRRFQEPIELRRDEGATVALKRATGPFILRRLKTDKSIISDLPDKLEMKVWCNLTPEQASLYKAVVEDLMTPIEDSEGIERRGLVLAAMAKLKQVCNHPAQLLKDGSPLPGRSGKLQRLEELTEEICEEGDKALVFTQYAEFGTLLQPHLESRLDRPVLWLHGGLSKKRRDALVDRFQSDDEPMIFLLSLKAAGTGLNLTAANHVIHLDRWWNPAVEDQATDRAFRIGQSKNVQVRKFVCAGTLEERIDEMIEKKKGLAQSVVGTGEDWLTDLSTDELRDIFRLGAEAVAS